MLLQKTYTVDYAHRLKDHKGPCSNLHGHTGVIEIFLSGEVEQDGMIVDFGELQWLKRIVNKLDHAVLLEGDDELLGIFTSHPLTNSFRKVVFSCPPTAEVIVLHLGKEITECLVEMGVTLTLKRIRFAETPGNVIEWNMGE